MAKSPTNKEEYWLLVYDHWENLYHILNIYLPTFSNKWIDNSELQTTLAEYLLELKNNKNPRLVRAFNAAWWNCPEENAGIWAHKDWDVLCELCSEEYCLYEEKETE